MKDIKIILENLKNFGQSDNIFIPIYGTIIKNGKVTKEGIKYYKNQLLKEKSDEKI